MFYGQNALMCMHAHWSRFLWSVKTCFKEIAPFKIHRARFDLSVLYIYTIIII